MGLLDLFKKKEKDERNIEKIKLNNLMIKNIINLIRIIQM